MSRLVDLAGKQFGKWIVLGRGETVRNSSGTRVKWRCRCECGTERELLGHYLRSGESKSCGCMANQFKRAKLAHVGGKSDFPSEYRIWQSMKARCKYPNRPSAQRYHVRGIKVCDRWAESFVAFLEDMGPRPSPTHSIDRIDGDGDYSPGNCRWATPKEQARNQSRNHLIVLNGETKPLCEWAAQFGLKPSTVQARLSVYGWSAVRALTEPARTWGR